MKPHFWTLSQTQTALTEKLCSAEELTNYFLDRIARYNPALHAFTAVAENAVQQARAADERRVQGRPAGPLDGIPIAVKDLFDTAGIPTAYGGRHFAGRIPAETAEAVRRLEQAGAIIIGKTNLHEYAYGTTTENPHFGNAANPWNRFKVAGGSSGGSSIAVTAGLAVAAIGTDTGGSIRIPAALTGHVGLKPTYGLVSKRGVFPLAPSLDHVGPMTKSVADAGLLLSIMAGFDPKDPGSVRIPPQSWAPRRKTGTIVVGVPSSFFYDRCQPTVLHVVRQTLQRLQDSGWRLEEIDIPDIQDVPHAQTTIIASEALSVHRHLLADQPALYGEDVLRRLELARTVSGADYVEASAFRNRFVQKLREVFRTVDVVMTPTTPLPATDIGQAKAHIRTQEVNIRGHLTRCTNPWNLSGLPAVSIPCGLTPEGLPVGLQCVGWRFSEPMLLEIAQRVEELTVWNPLAPDYR